MGMKMILIFLSAAVLLAVCRKLKDKRAKCCGLITGIIFEISLCIGRLVTNGRMGNMILAFGELVLWIGAFSLLYHFLLSYELKGEYEKYKGLEKNRRWLWVWGLIFLCWLPCYLSFYPGIMSYDSKRITEQALGLRPFDNFQPFLHTILWTACIRFEQWCGIAQSAIVIYSIGQMLVLSGVFTYALYYMVKNRINKIIVFLSFLMYAFCPSIVLFSFITTKDILFGASVLLLVLELTEFCKDGEAFMKRVKNIALLILTGIVSCLLRNNMIYVLFLTACVLPFVIRGGRKRMMIAFAAIICSYVVITGPVYQKIGVVPGYAREMLSVPLSQLANVYREEKQDLYSADADMMRKYIPDIEKYERQFADPIKYTFNEEAYKADKSEFWKLWIEFLDKEPLLYADAFLVLNAPLWYMESDTVDPYISLGRFSRHYTFEYKDYFPRINSFYTAMAEYNTAKSGIFRLPVIKQFFSVALPIWVLFVAFCTLIAKKKQRWLVPLLPLLLLWMTYLLGPVSNFRYMFPIIICYPIIVVIVMQNGLLEGEAKKGEWEGEV